MDLKRRVFASIFLGGALSAPAMADDWGCTVLLCLANPNGPEAVAECVPPIERLWDALWNDDPFPSCSGADGSSAGNLFIGYEHDCPFGYRSYTYNSDAGGVVYTGCRWRGRIGVTVSNRPWARVYWSNNGSMTESVDAATGQTQSDRDEAAWYSTHTCPPGYEAYCAVSNNE